MSARYLRRSAVASALCLALLALGGGPANAQDSNQMGRVSGVVLDAAGKPVPSVTVRFVRLDEQGRKPYEVKTNKKGRFTVGFFPPGAWRPEIASDELYVAKMEFRDRTPGGDAGGRGADEGITERQGTGAFDEVEDRHLAQAGASVDRGKRQGEQEDETGTPQELARKKATQQGGAPSGPTYFTVRMGKVIDMTLTTAQGKPVKVEGDGGPNALLQAAAKALEAGDTETVLATTERILALEPDRGLAVYMRGVALARKERFDEAVPLLRRAVELVPEQPGVRSMLATALLAQADGLAGANLKAEAKPLYGEAADLMLAEATAPNAPPSALGNAIYALEKAGRADEALKAMGDLVAKNPADVGLRLRHVETLRLAGRKDEALALLEKIEVPAADAANRLRLADALTNAGLNDRALAALEPVPIDSRDAAAVLYNAAAGLLNAGQTEPAVKALERAAAGQPELPFVRRALGLAYLSLDRRADAVRELKEALRLDPNGPNAATDREIVSKLEK